MKNFAWRSLGFGIHYPCKSRFFTELQLKTFLFDEARIFTPISMQSDIQNDVRVLNF